MSDPLASPTLAQLYLAQGLHGRARAILDQLLAQDAADGVTLALRDRLRVRARPELNVTRNVEGIAIRASWSDGSEPIAAEVICALWSRRRISAWITSAPLIGTTEISIPTEFDRAGSVAVLLASTAASRERNAPLEILAVAETVSW